jgi:hypothetical protein
MRPAGRQLAIAGIDNGLKDGTTHRPRSTPQKHYFLLLILITQMENVQNLDSGADNLPAIYELIV